MKIHPLIYILVFTILSSCYSFTGSSLNYDIVQTAKIGVFPNYSALQNPNLSAEFSNNLLDRFDQRTKLTIVNSDDADITIEGEITNYQVTPVTVVSGDQAAQNRLTIQVKVQYENRKEEDKSFNKTFSDYEDFEASQTLDQVQDDLVTSINRRIIDQIYNAIVADW